MNEENETDGVIKERVKQVEADIREIKDDIKTMPDKIAQKINEKVDEVNKNIDIKIRLAISETEKKYQAKLIGLLIAVLGEGVALIIKFIMG